MKCEDCSYRACREEDGGLGECKEPTLREDMRKLNLYLAISVISSLTVFIVTMCAFHQ